LLSFAFLFSFFVGVGVLGEWYRVEAILRANPQYHLSVVKDVFLFGILPITLGLVFCIIAYVKAGHAIEGSNAWPLLIVGGFFALWGFLYFRTAYSDYSQAVDWANTYLHSYNKGSFLAIYTAYGLLGILWLVAGVFLMIFMFKRLKRES
jgi:hypothetical protein